MAISSLPNTRGKADAIDSGSDLFGIRLVWVERRPRRANLNRIHLHSLNALKCSRNPANAAFAMHSFNRQRQHVLNENSPLTGLDAYTPQGYSSCSNFCDEALNPSCRLHKTLHPAHHSHTLTLAQRNRNGRLAQLVRAPALQAGCRGFESLTAHHPLVSGRPRKSRKANEASANAGVFVFLRPVR